MCLAIVRVPDRKFGEVGLWGTGPFIHGGTAHLWEGAGPHVAHSWLRAWI